MLLFQPEKKVQKMKNLLFLSGILLVLHVCACSRFSESNGDSEEQKIKSGPVSKARFEKICDEKKFIYAHIPGNNPRFEDRRHLAAVEADIVRQIADYFELNVEYLEAMPDDMPALLRSGRADIASGGFSRKQIESFYLTPVIEYGKGILADNPSFIIRNDDPDWQALLEGGFREINFYYSHLGVSEQ